MNRSIFTTPAGRLRPFRDRVAGRVLVGAIFVHGLALAQTVATAGAGSGPPAEIAEFLAPFGANRESSIAELTWSGAVRQVMDRIERVETVTNRADLIRHLGTWVDRLDDDPALLAHRALARWASSLREELAVPARAVQTRRADAATRRLRALGGTVFSRDGELLEVVLNGCPVTDDDLRCLRGWTRLMDVSLEGTEVSDAGLRHLAGLPKLEWLNLYRSRTGDDGLRVLASLPSLRHLPVGETRVTDAGLAHFLAHRDLEYLGLRGNAVTDLALAHLRGWKRLAGLNLGQTRVTDAGLSELASLPALRRLWLDGTSITAAAVPHLVPLADLEELHLDAATFPEEARRTLRKALSKCRIEFR